MSDLFGTSASRQEEKTFKEVGDMKQESKLYNRNSELFLIREYRNCNPNGDPDAENVPRQDSRGRAEVSDVRLKRDVRNYLKEVHGLPIFVTRVGDTHVDAHTRLVQAIVERKIAEGEWSEEERKEKLEEVRKNVEKYFVKEDITGSFIDIRLFGATLTIKPDNNSGKGKGIDLTGSVQINWGMSLHKVKFKTDTITSVLAGRTNESGSSGGGSIAPDPKVEYALVGFYGRISGHGAKDTGLTWEDVKLLDRAMWYSGGYTASTRTKVGQMPVLYVRVEYKDKETFIGNPFFSFKLVTDKEDTELESLDDFELDITRFVEKVRRRIDRIEKVFFKAHEDLTVRGLDELKSVLGDKFVELEWEPLVWEES